MAVHNIPEQKSIDYSSLDAACLIMYEQEKGDVIAKTLDSYGLEKIDFMKLDCQGSDYDVLVGGIETITRYRPVIIYEFERYPGVHDHNGSEYQEFFKKINYNVKSIAGNNYLATPK